MTRRKAKAMPERLTRERLDGEREGVIMQLDTLLRAMGFDVHVVDGADLKKEKSDD